MRVLMTISFDETLGKESQVGKRCLQVSRYQMDPTSDSGPMNKANGYNVAVGRRFAALSGNSSG